MALLALLLPALAAAAPCRTDFVRDVAQARRQPPAGPRPLFSTPGAVVGDVLVLEATLCDDLSRCTLKPDGERNGVPRYDFNHALAARQVYASGVADDYDQLVLFFAFHPTSAGRAYYTPVFNDLRGINFAQDFGDGGRVDEQLNLRALFGASRTLRGVVVMGDLHRCAFFTGLGVFPDCADRPPFPASPESVHGILAQETGHAFGAFVRFTNDGIRSEALLGRDRAHWSYLVDSGGSPLEGNRWVQEGETFRLGEETPIRFSPLDQYLMGVRAADEVPPFLLIRSPDPSVEPALPPRSGPSELKGAARTVRIDEIVAAEGPRVPGAESAPRTLRQLFVLLVLPGETPQSRAEEIAAIGRIRAHWPGLFYDATEERMRVLTTVSGADDLPRFSFGGGAEGFTAAGGELRWKAGALELDADAQTVLSRDGLALDASKLTALRLRLGREPTLTGAATLELVSDTGTQLVELSPEAAGVRDWAVALPPGLGNRISALRLRFGSAGSGRVRLESLELSGAAVQDLDGDAVEDAVDNCRATPNPSQADLDGDGGGDACDGDRDGDGIADNADNCPEVANADQRDDDEDGRGDACAPPESCGCSNTGGMNPLLPALLVVLLGSLRRRRPVP